MKLNNGIAMLAVSAAIAGTWLATLKHGASGRSSTAAPVAMVLTPSSSRVTARTLTRTAAALI